MEVYQKVRVLVLPVSSDGVRGGVPGGAHDGVPGEVRDVLGVHVVPKILAVVCFQTVSLCIFAAVIRPNDDGELFTWFIS